MATTTPPPPPPPHLLLLDVFISMRAERRPFNEATWPHAVPSKHSRPETPPSSSGAGEKQVLHVEEACFQAAAAASQPASRPAPLSTPPPPPPPRLSPPPPPLSPLATWMLSTRRLAAQFSRTPPPGPTPALLSEWRHTLCATPPPPPPPPPRGFLAGAQKCKTMFWFGSTTCKPRDPQT